jgi:hypothetical protein
MKLSRQQIKVAKLFPITDRNQVIVHLESHDFDFGGYGEVILHLKNEVFKADYIGAGDQSGVPFIVLDGLSTTDIRALCEGNPDSELFLERPDK